MKYYGKIKTSLILLLKTEVAHCWKAGVGEQIWRVPEGCQICGMGGGGVKCFNLNL